MQPTTALSATIVLVVVYAMNYSSYSESIWEHGPQNCEG